MQKEGITCDRIWNGINYISDTLPSFRHFFRELKSYNQTSLMKYFEMSQGRSFDGFTDVQDLRELVYQALDERIHPAFFEWSQKDFKDFCHQNYPECFVQPLLKRIPPLAGSATPLYTFQHCLSYSLNLALADS